MKLYFIEVKKSLTSQDINYFDSNEKKASSNRNSSTGQKDYHSVQPSLNKNAVQNDFRKILSNRSSSYISCVCNCNSSFIEPMSTRTKNIPELSNKRKNNLLKQHDQFDAAIKRNFGDIINTLKITIEQNEIRLRDSEHQKRIQNDWNDVAKILDHLFFYLFSVITLVCTAKIFLKSPHSLKW